MTKHSRRHSPKPNHNIAGRVRRAASAATVAAVAVTGASMAPSAPTSAESAKLSPVGALVAPALQDAGNTLLVNDAFSLVGSTTQQYTDGSWQWKIDGGMGSPDGGQGYMLTLETGPDGQIRLASVSKQISAGGVTDSVQCTIAAPGVEYENPALPSGATHTDDYSVTCAQGRSTSEGGQGSVATTVDGQTDPGALVDQFEDLWDEVTGKLL